MNVSTHSRQLFKLILEDSMQNAHVKGRTTRRNHFTAGTCLRTVQNAGVFCICFYLLTFFLCTEARGFEQFNANREYDRYFSKYAKRYFGPGFDWRYFKAQAAAESGLNAHATSPVGARGIMQIMPPTFAEIKQKSPGDILGAMEDARWNIAAGIRYDRSLWNLWKAPRPFQDRMDFMFGAYNAGKGTLLRAQKKAEALGINPNLWTSMETVLPDVTGHHSRETIGYVNKIKTIKEILE
ncbi:MAG: hypothetical protein CSA22_00465 [Deltaproteobacteria bacterium]|nr:MAG: hypothetical protein CSA22_00465 [Deltaproteobacteria bacterium]